MMLDDVYKLFLLYLLGFNFVQSSVMANASEEENSKPNIPGTPVWTDYKRENGDENHEAAVVVTIICLGGLIGFLALFCIIRFLRDIDTETLTSTRLYDCTEYGSNEAIGKTGMAYLKIPTNDELNSKRDGFQSTVV